MTGRKPQSEILPTPRAVIRQIINTSDQWMASSADKVNMRRGLAWFVWLPEKDQEDFIKHWNVFVTSQPNFSWASFFELVGNMATNWEMIMVKAEEIHQRKNGHYRVKTAREAQAPKVLTQYHCQNCDARFGSEVRPITCPLCSSAKGVTVV